jgi:hypothetical protein
MEDTVRADFVVPDTNKNVTTNNDDQKDVRKMKNDLLDTAATQAPHDFAQIVELSKYKFERAKAQEWASKEIKFLVYDDTDVKTNGYDSDDEEGMLEHASKMSCEDGESLGQPIDNSILSPEHAHHHDKFACRICSSYPEFPHKWKPRKFRLVKPTLDHPELFATDNVASVDICMHYVAISYCWPPREENPAPREYTVRDLDGTVRSSRALDDILDRAVDFANSCGLRMIWIDQECLPQPIESSSEEEWQEQELGIQAMDIVYNRAMVTAGLLSVEIKSQDQLTAIEALLYFDRERREMMFSQQFCESLLDFIHRTSEDRWYTRAWVVQESLCAGEKLMLAFRRGLGLKFPSKFRYGYEAEREDRPYHSLDDTPRGFESELVCMRLRDFWRILDDLKYLVGFGRFTQIGTQLTRPIFGPVDDAQIVLRIGDALHPRIMRANTLQQDLKIYGGGHYGKRPTINAAGALTLLKHRQCYFDSDRLAIVANMCDYEFRLNTREVDNNCTSLRLAMLALSLNNGDLSLLVPEAYLPWDYIYSDDYHITQPGSSILYQEFVAEAPRIEYCRVRDFINIRLQSVQPGSVTPAGLLLRAYLWSVDRFIDFSVIRAQWADTWESLRCWRMMVDRQEYETQAQFHIRQAALGRQLSLPGISQLALREFQQLGNIPHDSVVWNGVDSSGVTMTRRLSSARIAQTPEMQAIIARILFAILRFTHGLSTSFPLAQGLANSLWQSVRIDQVPGSEDALPDEVGNELFTHTDVLTRPWDTLQIDTTLEDAPAQLWFIDRIMDHGGLWCGGYIRPGISPSEYDSDQPSPFHSSSSFSPERKRDSIISRQIQRQMLTGYMQVSSSLSPNSLTTKSRHAFITLMDVIRDNYMSEESEMLRERSLAAAFDVDGPCCVGTPFNPEWEILPRPELRSGRVCWVVEGSKRDGPKSSDVAKGKRKREDGDRFGDQGVELKVLRKVKGLWGIMDLPSQAYTFS